MENEESVLEAVTWLTVFAIGALLVWCALP
jgi:hypothetical protein